MKFRTVFLLVCPFLCPSATSPIPVISDINYAWVNTLAEVKALSPHGPVSPVGQSGNAMDHPVILGERARDIGAGEHTVQLLFMVIAFVITLIAGFVLLERWRRKPRPNSHSHIVPVAMVFIAAVLAFVTALLLWNVIGNNMAADHPITLGERARDIVHNHHFIEILLSFLACVILVITGFFLFRNTTGHSDVGSLLAIFISALPELIVILILLNIFHNSFYKLCNNTCVMLGSQAGTTYDLPCADNIAFMALHHTQNLDVEDYRSTYESLQEFPLFLDYASPTAMHDPLFPTTNVVGGNTISEPIAFSLHDDKNLIETCSLYVRVKHATVAELEGSFSLGRIQNNVDGFLVASWQQLGGIFQKVLPGSPPAVSFDENISHQQTVPGEPGKITYVTYKFEVTFFDDGDIQNPPEDIEVTFVLRNYHDILPYFPAPVYVQGNMQDVMDVLFIPSNDDGRTDQITEEFLDEFRESCRLIIKDAVFHEPSLKFLRKQFNFWINNQPGQAADARCQDCCHVPPDNFDTSPVYISEDIEFKALLHKGVQWDFTDHCNTFFSAEMNLVNDNDEKSSFLHELGHAAFGLSDEYNGGFNVQATEHLPNNWETRPGAESDASSRHKTEDDVKKLF